MRNRFGGLFWAWTRGAGDSEVQMRPWRTIAENLSPDTALHFMARRGLIDNANPHSSLTGRSRLGTRIPFGRAAEP